ncbi:---NA--- [Pelobates cultripes]|uniref:---NA n=1 Tax=Pelobates cultripes TaxID=61616 RepID=A0AAD1S3U5_PELCU|nr:---NA--- [Pelobates cultripes]
MIGDFSLQPRNTNNGREKKRGRSKVKHFLQKIMNKWHQKQQSVWITASSVSFEDVSSQILSNKSIIANFQINMEFEEKTSSSFNGQSKNQPPILSINVQITSTFNLEKDKNGFQFTWKQCEVSIKDIELIGSEEDDFETDKFKKLLEIKVCSLLPLLADNMNRLFMNILNIDPTGFNKLIVKSIKQSSAICLELDLNLVVNNVERKSEGEHGYMLGNGISVLKVYTNYMLSVNAHAEMLNKILASKNFTLSPDELQLIIHDANETESVKLKIHIKEPPKLTDESGLAIMLISGSVGGCYPNSDESIFNVDFDTKVEATSYVKGNKLYFTVAQADDPAIWSWSSNIGKTGDMDYNSLVVFTKKCVDEKLLPVMNDLQMNIPLPNTPVKSNYSTYVVVDQESVAVILENISQ